MPTYDYVCESCGFEFEQFQTITARPIRKCPKCGKTTLKRLIGVGAGVIFKGSGFYQTDYRSESYKKAAEKDKPGGDTKDKAKTKTDVPKTAEKAEAATEDKKKSA